MEKIDAVITWVDGDDPRHKAKRQAFTSPEMVAEEHIASSTRFSSLGEIFYCVASINRFAPWINKIYMFVSYIGEYLPVFSFVHKKGRGIIH